MTVANAGHPAPVVVSPEGEARFLDKGRGSPLGTARGEDAFDETEHELPAGSLLFFYTDGLVERRGTPLLDSLENLRKVVEAGPAEPEALCEHVRSALLGDEPPRDDVAFIAVRLIPLKGEHLKLTMPAEPKTLVAARSIVGRWLTAAGADEQAVRDLQMACHEACANVIEHAYRFREATFELEGRVVGRRGRADDPRHRRLARSRQPGPRPRLRDDAVAGRRHRRRARRRRHRRDASPQPEPRRQRAAGEIRPGRTRETSARRAPGRFERYIA